MTMSDMMPRPKRFNPGCLMQFCLMWLVACHSAMSQLGFVHGLSWLRHGVAVERVTRSFSQKRLDDANWEPTAEIKAKRLTTRMKHARSAQDMIDILDRAVDDPIFNFFHASAAYHKLATLKRRRGLRQEDWESAVLLGLHARVKDMVLQDQLEPRQSATILWSIAQLSDGFQVPTQLLAALANSIPAKVKGMVPQALSNCLWACLQLADDVPEVLRIVPTIVQEIPEKIEDMVPQALCNSLDALILLQESVPEVTDFLIDRGSKTGIVRSAATHLNTLLPELTGKDLTVDVPAVVWACAKVSVYHPRLLASVAQRFRSRAKLSRLKDFGLCALSWSYQVLDRENDFVDFWKMLKAETQRRGLSEADVESSRLGYLKYMRADV